MRRSPTLGREKAGQGTATPRGWVAEGRARQDGRQAAGDDEPALVIFAVSVNVAFSTSVDDRLRLMQDVADRFASRVPRGVPSLWVFPGGHFGYNAQGNAFADFDEDTRSRIECGILDVAQRLPVPSLVAVGVDSSQAQQAWIFDQREGGTNVSRVTRAHTDLAARCFSVGSAWAAFFICGEFTGSRTAQNGPFGTDRAGRACYLSDPVTQLQQCDVLVDLAHLKVSGSVSGVCGPRMVHRRQMERVATAGVGVLTHHHSGVLVAGRPHFKHQSNWIIFKGGRWLPELGVTPLP